MNIPAIRKFLVALGGVFAVFATVTVDGTLDANDIGAIVVAALTAFGVYTVRNART